MTDIVDAAVPGEEPKAPAGHYYVTMKDRRVLVKEINIAQNMVLGGIFRKNGETQTIEQNLDTLGKLMRLVEALIPNQEDIDWMESGILDGKLDVPDFAVIFMPVTDGGAPAKKRQPRRGR